MTLTRRQLIAIATAAALCGATVAAAALLLLETASRAGDCPVGVSDTQDRSPASRRFA
jgi:hypothetical protein